LRDHFATSLVDEGVDLEIVRQLLGHANLNNIPFTIGLTMGSK
jgi:site-specific recombinase XerD